LDSQGGHSPGKPGKPGIVREFKSGQGKKGKVRENVFLHVQERSFLLGKIVHLRGLILRKF